MPVPNECCTQENFAVPCLFWYKHFAMLEAQLLGGVFFSDEVSKVGTLRNV
ncbi:hypothetical protein GGTG_14370 [Gaeumannomyces tritici R3-111a-1]|uniref:Uncharacterized protein n=1 Tax=Gaeumannomyces tritici (strain R3-111a-1) TaxID=644352 RepID=J3PLB2_GAET3|nr:hypothetical protein GGTG_14370 [Gaeumannomyces tritici R3-111a-1]EJT68051.1 hypothetical protein GGTG_14370 [Gaeumannomyces tritici R3-111a-1]